MELLNRGFKYGDGFFESLRVIEGNICFVNYHLQRIQSTLDLMQIQPPRNFGRDWLVQLVDEYLHAKYKQDSKVPAWRLRISFFRAGGGLYTPDSSQLDWALEALPLANKAFKLNAKGLCLGCCPTVLLSADSISSIKSISALPYVMAANFLKHQLPDCDDLLLMNTHHRIAEALAANVFIRKGHQFFTPALSEAPVAGTIRAALLELLPQLNFEVIETKIEKDFLASADELLLTNAIQGLRWVEKLSFLEHPPFGALTAPLILEKLNALAFGH